MDSEKNIADHPQCTVCQSADFRKQIVQLQKDLRKANHKVHKAKRTRQKDANNKELRLELEKLKAEKQSVLMEDAQCQTYFEGPAGVYIDEATAGKQVTGTNLINVQSLLEHEVHGTHQNVLCESGQMMGEDTANPSLDPNQFSVDAVSLAEQLRSAAEEAVNGSSFQYDQMTGLYYDQQSQLYYNPKNQLYYDMNSGTYYSYNVVTGEYEYHSQVDTTPWQNYYLHQAVKREKEARRALKEARKARLDLELAIKQAKRQSRAMHTSDNQNSVGQAGMSPASEDKPLSDTHGSKRTIATTRDMSDEPDSIFKDENLEEGEVESSDVELSSSDADHAAELELVWRTPCIRLVVTRSDCADVGMLHIITVNGAYIGREELPGEYTICLPEECVSGVHCRVFYSSEQRCYNVLDYGSETGTLVNQKRLCEPGQSGCMKLSHRDVVVIGTTEFLLHIHPGTDTCRECQPGVTTSRQKEGHAPNERERNRRRELKRIKCKYGLENDRYVEEKTTVAAGYQDKAALRRKAVGSDHPYIADDEPSSVDRALPNTNIGHRLLEKMGWKCGGSLGKAAGGIIEPVKVDVRLNSNAGLGSSDNKTASLDEGGLVPRARKKTDIWIKTRQRYTKAKPSKAFAEQSEDDGSNDAQNDALSSQSTVTR